MSEIQLKLNDNGRGEFFMERDGERLALMDVGISGNVLTVYHTEVSEKLKGQGVGNMLLEEMVAYARKHKLSVIPLCKFVHLQFTRHPEKYADVWKKDWHDTHGGNK